LLKECTHKIKITYSRSARAYIKQLANSLAYFVNLGKLAEVIV